MKNFFKGFVIGVGKIIPGVSGAILAIIMGIYDKSIYYLSNFSKNKKESIKYLFPIAIGVLLAIILFSKIIDYALDKYYLITMLFFVGLIMGGLPFTFKKVNRNDYFITIIAFLFFFIISVTNINNNYIIKNGFFDLFIFMISGVVEAIGTVVPGISSTALLLIMGTYNIVISSIGNIGDFSSIMYNLKILIPFTFGLLIGIIIMVKVINILFKKYENKTYGFILGVLLSSIVLLVIQAFGKPFKIIELIVGIILMFFGIFISSIMEEK
ncbi:MAG: DUF368 domain-containing protein [Bacilli bacterium]|nr:DUF368 domain-containing protein [Bacilli bacterium]